VIESADVDSLQPGMVSLVGAGPGDPDLLTMRAVRRLNEADLLLYDGLVDSRVLDLAPRARRVLVDRRARHPLRGPVAPGARGASPAGVRGAGDPVRQEFVNWLMIRAARRGLRVVRLKGGDPFVLGRGGEEALALARGGVPFEIVPGVTSAVAAPALAGIPVTHRGIASAFIVVSGHAEAAYRPVLSTLAPHSATVVVLMGLGRIADVARTLVARGWSPSTPAAVLLAASTPFAESRVLALGELQDGVHAADERLPGTVVIGDVVAIRATLMGEARAETASVGS
jgi:uroporphyrin-III C-methyltransferase/precorrin-2 dehydrogenase/sirohydrochlorin ferrochelatase